MNAAGPKVRCSLCGGNAGQMPEGRHNLCAARAKHGAPTPSLGDRCSACHGAKTLGKGGVFLDFALGPRVLERSIAAQFPPCPTCNGTGIQPGTCEERAEGPRTRVVPDSCAERGRP